MDCLRWKIMFNSYVIYTSTHGEVSELADEHDLGSCAARLGGSSPPFPILFQKEQVTFLKYFCVHGQAAMQIPQIISSIPTSELSIPPNTRLAVCSRAIC